MNKNLQEPDWPFVSFWNLKSLFFTCSYLFLFAEPHVCCHSMSFVVTCCTSCCHSLSLDAPLVSLFMNSLPMLPCESFSQVFVMEIKKRFSIELSESIPIVASISPLIFTIFPVNLNGLEMNQELPWKCITSVEH